MKKLLVIALILTLPQPYVYKKASFNCPFMGINLVVYEPPEMDRLRDSLIEAREMGFNYVLINTLAFYDGHDIYQEVQDVGDVVRVARSLGMRVGLKPMVDPTYDEWRGHIRPSSRWLEVYREFILDWAEKAQEYEVDLFFVGVEYQLVEDEISYWRGLIKDVRMVYSGKVTYAANWDNFWEIEWWDELDYLSISAYFPIKERGWEYWLNYVREKLRSSGIRAEVIFSEVGYQSARGTLERPWDYHLACKAIKGGYLDLRGQAKGYESLFRALWESNPSYLRGVFFWDYWPDPEAGKGVILGYCYGRPTPGLDLYSYTPQNKPAELVIRRWVPKFTTIHVVNNSLDSRAAEVIAEKFRECYGCDVKFGYSKGKLVIVGGPKAPYTGATSSYYLNDYFEGLLIRGDIEEIIQEDKDVVVIAGIDRKHTLKAALSYDPCKKG